MVELEYSFRWRWGVAQIDLDTGQICIEHSEKCERHALAIAILNLKERFNNFQTPYERDCTFPFDTYL